MGSFCLKKLYYVLLAQNLIDNDVLKFVALKLKNFRASEIFVFEIQLTKKIPILRYYSNFCVKCLRANEIFHKEKIFFLLRALNYQKVCCTHKLETKLILIFLSNRTKKFSDLYSECSHTVE